LKKCSKKGNFMFSNLRSLIILILGLAMLIGCSREAQENRPVRTTTEQGTSGAPPAKQSAERDKALVRVVHAMATGPTVDVFADETLAFSNVTYKTVTPYNELPDDRLTFRVRAAAGGVTTKPLAENSEMLLGGRHYTVIPMEDDAGKITVRVLADDLTPAPRDQARVRVINASPDAGEVDVVAKGGNKAIFGGVNFTSEAGYKDVEPMRGDLEVRREGKKEVLPNQNWEPGKTYTIILAGRGKLEAITIEDQIGMSRASAQRS
jgi:Domain of unknown function (DUF4397)